MGGLRRHLHWTFWTFLIGAAAAIRFVVAPGYLAWLTERVHFNPADFLHRANELLAILLCATILFLVGRVPFVDPVKPEAPSPNAALPRSNAPRRSWVLKPRCSTSMMAN